MRLLSILDLAGTPLSADDQFVSQTLVSANSGNHSPTSTSATASTRHRLTRPNAPLRRPGEGRQRWKRGPSPALVEPRAFSPLCDLRLEGGDEGFKDDFDQLVIVAMLSGFSERPLMPFWMPSSSINGNAQAGRNDSASAITDGRHP